MINVYSAVYVLSKLEEGALAGIRIAGSRYSRGRVVVRTQDLLEVEGFSLFCAASQTHKLALFIHFSDSFPAYLVAVPVSHYPWPVTPSSPFRTSVAEFSVLEGRHP